MMPTHAPPGNGRRRAQLVLVIAASIMIIGGFWFGVIMPAQSDEETSETTTDQKCDEQQEIATESAAEAEEPTEEFTSGPVGQAKKREYIARMETKAIEAMRYLTEHCNEEESAADATSSTTAPTNGPPEGEATGTPDDPHVGDSGNTNPVLPASAMSDVRNWTDLKAYVESMPNGGQWYRDGLQNICGISWNDVGRASALEREQDWDGRFILASRSNLSPEQAQQQIGEPLPVVRKDGFDNTAGVPENRLKLFFDERSQVRVSLAMPADWNDLSKGLRTNCGVLIMCGNIWKDHVQGPPPTAPPAATTPGPGPTTPPTTPPTTSPPPTTPPPTTPPPTTPPTTSPPPTTPPTTSPPPTTQPCRPPGIIKDGKCEYPPASE